MAAPSTGAAQTGKSAAETAVQEAMRDLGLESTWNQFSPLVAQYGMRVLVALLFLGLAIYFSGKVGRAARGALERAQVELTLARFLGNVARFSILALAVLTCMAMVGIPVTSFAALLGASGLAVGLALQGSLSNVAAGAALSLTRPFKVGDLVVVAGQTGIIDEIGLFATTLNTPDNRRIIIPNGQIFGTIIENITHNPTRRVDVDVGTAYSASLPLVHATLESAARGVPSRVTDPPPLVMTSGFADSSINWKVCVWTRREDYLQTRQELFESIKAELDRAGIDIPFPQRVVTLAPSVPTPTRPGEGRRVDGAPPAIGRHTGVREVQEDLEIGEL